MEKREIDQKIVSKLKSGDSSDSIENMHKKMSRIGDGKDIPVKNKGVITLGSIEYNRKP